MFFDILQSLFETMYYSKYPNNDFEVEHDLKQEDLEKWYIDLWKLLDRYNIG